MNIYINQIHVYKTRTAYNGCTSTYKIAAGSAFIIDDSINTIQYADISKVKSLYFHKSSTYPRLNLQLPNVKRTVKIDNADAVVIDDAYDSKYIGEKIFKNELNLSPDIESGLYYNEELNQYHFFTNINAKDVSHLTQNLKKIENSNYDCITILTKNEVEFLDLIKSKSIITDTNLRKYIYSSLNKMTNEEYESIKTLLEGTDLANIELGLTLLQQYNLDDFYCKISMLLYDNYKTLCTTSAFDTISFKSFLNNLNLSIRELALINNDYYKKHNKYYINNIIKNAINSDDIKYAKLKLAEYIKEELETNFLELSNKYKDCKFELKIEVTDV